MQDRICRERAAVERRVIGDDSHYRLLVVGRYANGTSDIVACLIRALRNLGHHVLYFDAAKHSGLLHNPHRVRGGHGPIYVQADYLRDAVKRFKPQIVLLMANGMTFTPEDADWLRGQGAVVTGITLSDPDVLESVVKFAGTFDFHTTNAERALGMYKEQGVNNTLYFPFAIDRGFVCQEVEPAPEFNADVICLGHATARPERNSVMQSVYERIKDRYTVRTYGRGWKLPESKLVEGVEVLQAGRAGRIHVNFPATRAGYTNVKCGVFETIAAGNLLVTQRFDEMARFFDYDTEIAGYDSYEELPDLIESLLEEPGRIEQMAERAFHRLVREHLYEHRWKDLFATMRECDSAAWLGEKRSAEVKEILSRGLPRCRPILVSGFYGARNLGDDLILTSISDAIEKNVPGGRVTVAAQNSVHVEKHQGYESFQRVDTNAANYHASTADAVVLGGGGLWHDYTFERAGGLPGLFHGSKISVTGFAVLPLLANLRGVPLHVVGMGVGPLADSEARLMVAHLAKMASSVTVRDTESKALLDDIVGTTDIAVQAPDVVYGIDLSQFGSAVPSADKTDRLCIGVNLRPWARGEFETDAIVEKVAAGLQRVIATAGKPVHIVLLPMQEGPSFDRLPLAKLRDLIGSKATFEEMSQPLSIDEYLTYMRSIDVLVSMRLHACLLAHRVGTRAIGLSYDPKVALHFEELGRGEFALPLSFETDQLASAISTSLVNPLDDVFFAKLAAIENASRHRLTDVASTIAAVKARDMPWRIPFVYELPDRNATSADRAGQNELDNSTPTAFRYAIRKIPHGLRQNIRDKALQVSGKLSIVRRMTPKSLKRPLRLVLDRFAKP